MITTYKYYTKNKQRLAIRAIEIDKNHAEVTILTCSKRDMFSKKFAREVFYRLKHNDPLVIKEQTVHPQQVGLAHFGNFREAVFNYLNANFYKMFTTKRAFETNYLSNGKDFRVLDSKLTFKI